MNKINNINRYLTVGSLLFASTMMGCDKTTFYENEPEAGGYDVKIERYSSGGATMIIGHYDVEKGDFEDHIRAVDRGVQGYVRKVELNAYGYGIGSELEGLASIKETRRILRALERRDNSHGGGIGK